MDEKNRDLLTELQATADDMHVKAVELIANPSKGSLDLVKWARAWRKRIEPIYYPRRDKVAVVALAKAPEPRVCTGLNNIDAGLNKLAGQLKREQANISELRKQLDVPKNICRGQAEMFAAVDGVLDPYGSRCRDAKTGHWTKAGTCNYEPTGNKTTALGMDNTTQYSFEYRIVNLDNVTVSNDPFTFDINPKYPQELQPRLRDRAATRVQVEKIASSLKPDALITDFHVIDRGSPIVGPDMIVEAGNGRVMGLKRAAKEYPEQFENYVTALKYRVRDYGLSPKDLNIDRPVLVRVRLTDIDRVKFAQEANAGATIAPSAIENARTDAQKITLSMIKQLTVGDNESIEDALRAPKNQAFALQFLKTLPDTVQAALVDAKGYLNRDGVHRMAMAIFVSAFQGDTGLRLAEKAFETLDTDVRNVINAISRSLGKLAEAESLIHSGQRKPEYSIADDLAQTVVVYSAIKNNPALTVEKYLSQSQLFTRELSQFQEGVLVVIDNNRRSAKRLGEILNAYAESVVKLPPVGQASLIPEPDVTKDSLWSKAIETIPAAESVAMFQNDALMVKIERQVCSKVGCTSSVKARRPCRHAEPCDNRRRTMCRS